MRLFLTLGTSGHQMEPVVETIDRQLGEGRIAGTGIAQIGLCRYEPKHLAWFRFDPDLSKYYEDPRVDVVVSHGGAGSLFTLLAAGCRVVAVENRAVTDRHQRDLIGSLERDGYVWWCRDPAALAEYVAIARTGRPRRYVPPQCWIADDLLEFLRHTPRTKA